MIFRLWLLFCLCGVCVHVQGQSDLKQNVQKILLHSDFEYASVGLSVRGVDGVETLNIDADKKYIPASSLKLITTFLALKEFGEAYTFSTRVGYQGVKDSSGTLNGNLIIAGSGDPTFGSDRFGNEYGLNQLFNAIASGLEKEGIKCIEGKIEVKTNIFKGQAICPSWPYSDIANYYGSGAWALNFNENKYDLIFAPNVEQGSIAKMEGIEPEIPNMFLKSEVIVKGPSTGDNAYIYGDPFNYSKIVRGSIPFSKKPFVIKGAIPNPPLSFGYYIENELKKKGVKTNGSIVTDNRIKRSLYTPMFNLSSPPLSKIVKQANFESINLYCEALLKLLGRKSYDVGSFETGIKFISESLRQAGLSEKSFTIKDGGGLSPRNSIAPSSFTQFLHAHYTESGPDIFHKYLPQVGVSGTVKSLMNGKKGQRNFYLKSGSMGGVLSYTGKFKAASGKTYMLCFISNNHPNGNRRIRLQAEKIFELLYTRL